MVNKYHLPWQVARLKAKYAVSSATEKMEYIGHWYEANPSMNNRERVINWIRTTAMGYKGRHREAFDRLRARVQSTVTYTEEYGFAIESYETKVLEDLLKDLNRRKYDFQFKGKIPKDHVQFVNTLEQELDRRSENG